MKKKDNFLFKIIDKDGNFIAYTKDPKHANLIIGFSNIDKKSMFKLPYTIDIVDEFSLKKVKKERLQEFLDNYEDYSE